MTTYQVTSEDGYEITDGLQEHEARQVAQRIADRRGTSVWLSESGSDDLGDEIRAFHTCAICGKRGPIAEDETEPGPDTLALDALGVAARNEYVCGSCLAKAEDQRTERA